MGEVAPVLQLQAHGRLRRGRSLVRQGLEAVAPGPAAPPLPQQKLSGAEVLPTRGGEFCI